MSIARPDEGTALLCSRRNIIWDCRCLWA